MINILGLDHLVLRANDAPRLIAFYRDILGCAVERELPELGLSQLRAGNALIDIVAVDSELGRKGGEGPKTQGRNLDHFCLLIDEISKPQLLQYLDDKKIPHGGYEERYGAQGFGDSVYIEDPESNIVELKFNKTTSQS